jgi:hypothetical protein
VGKLINNQDDDDDDDNNNNNNNNNSNLNLILTMLEATYRLTPNYASRSFGDLTACEARLKF